MRKKKSTLLLLISVIFFSFLSVRLAFAVTPFFQISSTTQEVGVSGHDGELWRIAKSYVAQSNQTLCAVTHGMGQSNASDETINLTIFEGGSGPDEGTEVSSIDINATELPAHAYDADARFVLPECIQLTSGTTYWFVFAPSFTQSPVLLTSAYRASDEFSYTARWERTMPVMEGEPDPNASWHEVSGSEWSLGLEGEEVVEPPAETKEPVIIVPGILGSELYTNNGYVWPNLSEMFADAGDEFLTDELSLNSSGQSLKNVTVGQIIKKLVYPSLGLGIDIFDSMITALENADYTSSTLFTFPYDWRLNIDSNRAALNQKINDVRNQTGSAKVDIVAHSMGGLVTKDFIAQYGTSTINKLILVGTPHLGAPKAAKLLIAGDKFGIPWLEPLRMKEIALGSPSTYELMPSPTYFSTFSGYLWPANYSIPAQYGQTQTFLQMFEGAGRNIFNQADSFFNKNLQAIDLTGIDVYNISGCKNPTQAGYKIKQNNFEIGQTGYTSGDGTVPLISADYITIASSSKFYVKNAAHSELPSTSGVRNLITQLLTSTSTTLASNVSRSKTFCDFSGKELAWHSPVEIHIYDSLNRHTGPTSTMAIEYGIPNIDYDIIGHDKFVFLPTDNAETYRVETKALGQGVFDFSITQNTNGSLTKSYVFNDVAITSSSIATISVSGATSDNILNIDRLGNNNFVQINADAVLQPQQIGDLTPPITTFSASGTLGVPNIYRSNLSLTLSATDNQSGVLYAKYALNGSSTFLTYTAPITISQEGTTTIQYYSVDNAGNNETIQSKTITIDKTPPEFTVIFDPTNLDYDIKAIDNLDQGPIIQCVTSECHATDQAGNYSKIVFKAKDRKKNPHVIELTSISYNTSTAIVFPDNTLKVVYKVKKDELKDFDHTLTIKKQEKAIINYEKKKDRSTVTIKEWKQKKDKEVMTGLHVIQLITNKGAIEAEIK